MTGEKRAYIPKVKGCYECSQRRIHCDRSEPKCAKCISRGLQCSGLGIRYRFFGDPPLDTRRVKSRTAHFQLPWPNEKKSIPYHSFSHQRVNAQTCCHPARRPCYQSRLGSCDFQDIAAAATVAGDGNDNQSTRPNQVVRSYTKRQKSQMTSQGDGGLTSLFPNDSLEPWKRHLLLHYAHNIAVELVVIDDQYNGWRHLVLSVASLDSLVLDAVLSAAAYHFWANVEAQTYQPELIYARAIRRLQERQNLVAQDTTDKQAVILALLVLLSTVMVNGGSDFPTIFSLLEAALKAIGGEDSLIQGELGLFVVRQVRKYRGYAAPLLSQEQGLARLSLSSSFTESASAAAPTATAKETEVAETAKVEIVTATTNGWDCFKSSYRSHPELSRPLSMIFDLNRQACDIYVRRVLTSNRCRLRSSHSSEKEGNYNDNGHATKDKDKAEVEAEVEDENESQILTEMVSKFYTTLQQLPDGTPGEHTLVFATFIAAAESVLPEHREFFTNALLKHYRRNGFTNLLLAIDHLKTIWSLSNSLSLTTTTTRTTTTDEVEKQSQSQSQSHHQYQQDWTRLLPEFRLFIV